MKLPEGSLLKPFLAQRLGEVNKTKAKRSLGQLRERSAKCRWRVAFKALWRPNSKRRARQA